MTVSPATGSVALTVRPEARLVEARFAPDTSLTAREGEALVEALKSVMGEGDAPFALFADAAGVRATDAGYRAVTGAFFKQHRAPALIALVNLGPVIRVVAEMFRVGIGLQLKTFGDEAAARAWLRAQGIPA